MLSLKNINKKFGQFRLTGISLEISEGTYFVLLGRSGSGKTRLLELIAGLTTPDSGKIWLGGEDITEKRIQRRGVGLVFQDYAIFPNMTVFGNIAYPLRAAREKSIDIRRKVNDIAGELNILHLLGRDTRNLSGGELQRVALARTLVNSPKLLLLDEPMASIDASLKDDVRRLLRRLNKRGLTIVHVTHDYREAVSLASEVGVIHNGRIIQSGTPVDVFNKPVSRFVARYAGIRNFMRVTFERNDGSWNAITAGGSRIGLPPGSYPDAGLLLLRSDDIVYSTIRLAGEHENVLEGLVTDVLRTETGFELSVDTGEVFYVDVTSGSFGSDPVTEGAKVWIGFSSQACMVIEGGS